MVEDIADPVIKQELIQMIGTFRGAIVT